LLRLRLRRTGKKKMPCYRIVVADSRAPRDGAFVEIVGTYDPLTEPATVVVDAEKVRAWIRKGAQPSDTVAQLLKRAGALEPEATPVS
jgi:small subunit ribosomal protein S16